MNAGFPEVSKFLLTSFMLVFASTSMPSSAVAQEQKTMKIGLATAESHIQNTGSKAFKEFIEEKTDGAIKVEIYPGAQLGDNKTLLDSLKIGAVDGMFPSPADLGNLSKDFNILNFPFIFPTQEIANEIMDGPWGDQMLDTLARYGYKGLAIVDGGFRHTTNSVRPIKSLDDFDGLKIRMQPNPLHLDIFRALGANPHSDELQRVILRSPAGRHGRPGKPAQQHLCQQAERGSEVSHSGRSHL